MQKRRKKPEQERSNIIEYYCRDCKNVKEVLDFSTLSIHERKPTLGQCPYWTKSRCVILSQKCCANFEAR